MIKLKKDINFKTRKKTQESSSKPYKHGQRSQTRNPLNFKPEMNQVVQSLTKLIVISQSKSNNEQQLKKNRED
jgi:hypothetical protein